jgi:hypothetical protein
MVLLLLPLAAVAQDFFLLDSVHKALEGRGFVRLEADYEYGSTTIHNDLMLGLIQAEFISRETRMRSSDAIDGSGVAGQSMGIDLCYMLHDSLFGRNHLRSQLHIGHRDMIGVSFDKELFDIAFFGNKQFEDVPVNVAPSAGEQQTFQKVGWGIVDERTLSSASISFVRGQRLQHIDLEKAVLLTTTDGRRIDAEIQGKYMLSDTADGPAAAFNGAGAAIDIAINRPVNWLKSGWLSIQIADAGFVSWNKNTLSLDKDTSYSYDGILVENLFDLDGLVLGENAIRDTLGLNFEKGTKTRLMPFLASIGLSTAVSDRIHLEVSGQYRYLKGYTPQVRLNSHYQLGPFSRGSLLITYGGFTGLRAGIGYEALIAERLFVRAAIPNIPGPLSDSAKGMEGRFGVGYLF